ncbi:unnamed protein product [Urochloa humidicola]
MVAPAREHGTAAMYALVKMEAVRLGFDGCFDSSSGGSSTDVSSRSGLSESDGYSSGSADDLWRDKREFQRHASSSPSMSRFRPISKSFQCAQDDVDRHQQRMIELLPAFSCAAVDAARAEALFRWLDGFGVGWVLDMDDQRANVHRRRERDWEVGRRVREWALALSTMERVFRLGHQKIKGAQVAAALGELAAESASAMLQLAGAVVALGSSPSKVLAALDVYAPVSEAFPLLGRVFSWGPSHPVSAAAEAMLAALVDAARCCGRDLRTFIRSHYPWQMTPQDGEVHPCVGLWMDYFRCMIRNRVSICFVLGGSGSDGDGGEDAQPTAAAEGGLGLVAELISCLEAVLEEKSAALAFPGMRQVFMLNNTFAILRRAVRCDLKLLLPPGWVRAREERMEGYIKGYMDVSWAPVVSRLDDAGGGTSTSTTVLRRRTSRLGAFYTALENACSAQRCWKVPNPVVRGILRNTVSAKVVPAYRRYLENHPELELAAGRSVEELEQQLSDLFEG